MGVYDWMIAVPTGAELTGLESLFPKYVKKRKREVNG